MSGQVASHTRSLPLLQGTSVTPSGCFPSDQGETSWSQPGRQLGCRQCTVDNVVDNSMTLVTALTPFAAEAVRGSAINLHATVVTGVGAAKE